MRHPRLRSGLAAAALLLAALPAGAQENGAELYEQNCSSCHGPDREGMGDAFPSLVGVGERLEADEIRTIIAEGKGLMPPFSQLTEDQREALVVFLTDGG